MTVELKPCGQPPYKLWNVEKLVIDNNYVKITIFDERVFQKNYFEYIKILN